jgi:short-subunit dehydrogenase
MKSLSTAVITGVSTGIGYETARTLAGRGFHVFGSVRRSADADQLKAELGDQFTPLQFDLKGRRGHQDCGQSGPLKPSRTASERVEVWIRN